MPHFDNTFGIEIECYLPADTTRQQLADAVSQRLGRDNSCNVEGYSHRTPADWKIVTDGSLNSYDRGVEIVSPILLGEDGLIASDKVCRALTDFGCTVNKKCGLHVHVGVGNASLRFWKDIVSIYSIFEPIIDSMMPASRRASTNAYCASMTSTALSVIAAQVSFDNLLRAIGGGRYRKVNMAAYLRHRTVEFRQHSGTTDANKVRNWILICLKMVDAAKRETFNAASYSAPIRNAARPGTKNYMVGELLLRPDGVTSAEALAATGWTTVSVPEIARFCGISFTSQKMGRVTRYRAVQNASQSATLGAFASLIGLDVSETSYMSGRINDLSGTVAWAA